MWHVTHIMMWVTYVSEWLTSTRERCVCQKTHYCNTLLQHATATYYYNILLQHINHQYARDVCDNIQVICHVHMWHVTHIMMWVTHTSERLTSMHERRVWPNTSPTSHSYVTCHTHNDVGYSYEWMTQIYTWQTSVTKYTLLQHATATRYCNTLLQHTTATYYCSTSIIQYARDVCDKIQVISHLWEE